MKERHRSPCDILMNSNTRRLLSSILNLAGGIAMVVGAIDPMEGSLLILPGSALVALCAFLNGSKHRFLAYRVWVFILIAIGFGALWGLSAVGGFGGSTGRSMWWGALIMPLLIGWSMGIWGPGSPRWMLWLGIAVGVWYLVIFAQVVVGDGLRHIEAAIVIATVGAVTIGGCIWRLIASR
jgi:hypothetical protein